MQVCGWRWGSQSALEAQLGMLAQAASVASRYAFGADGVGAARPGASAARLIAASRSGLGVRRSALSGVRPSACCTPALHRRRAPAKAAHGAQLEAPNCAVPLEEAPAQEQVLVRLLADPLARVTVRSSCA